MQRTSEFNHIEIATGLINVQDFIHAITSGKPVGVITQATVKRIVTSALEIF